MALEDYKDLVGTVATVTTILQFLSGVFVCKDIKKKGTSGQDSIIPFLGGCIISALNLKYGLLLGDSAMVVVNVVGLLLNLCYLSFFYSYSPYKSESFQSMVKGSVFMLSLLAYAQFWEDPDLVETRFGTIVTVLLIALIASPLFSLKEVIRSKSTASLPFPIILGSSVVTFEWLLYGIIIKNPFLQVQNAIGFSLCAIQLTLFVIYPRTPAKKAKKEKSK